MTEPLRWWTPTELCAEFGDEVVYARSREARWVALPATLGLPGPRVPDLGWERQTADIHTPDRTVLARAWSQALDRPGEPQQAILRQCTGGEWHRTRSTIVDLTHQEEFGVILVAIADLGRCERPEARTRQRPAGQPDDGAAQFDRPTWILQETDAVGCVISTEGDADAIFGRPAEDLLGKTILDFFHPGDHEACLEMWSALLVEPGGTRTIRQRVLRPDGSVCWIESTVINRLEADGSGVLLSVSHDVTERRRRERDLHSRAREDPLTRLPNRVAVIDDLTALVATGPATVAFVDLDGFKEVNDELGHHVGDEVLAALASRLRREIPLTASVGRWGGDEFVVIGAGDARDLLRDSIDRAFANPVAIGDAIWHPRGSYGMTLGGSGDDPNLLIRSADTAMYQAKERRPRG